MRLGMYSIFDKLTGYMVPAYHQNDEQAVRAFSYDLKSEVLSLLTANPEDFQLERVGYFDTDSGIVESCKPEVISTALTMVRKEL